ncbi:hypothetical protein [Shimia sp.]|uniref:hypothetical protein n=1 Tax=Shimia sp. TaxID=1954381 RepID=UPI003568D971
MEFKPLRAPAYREFVGPEFGAGEISDEAAGLKLTDIMAHPKLSELAVSVWEELRDQFAAERPSAKQQANAEELAYREKLEKMALVLEILLEETLDELELLNGGDPNLSRVIV